MGRKNKYETHIQPNLAKISEWVATMTEAQIAQKLGVNVRSFDRYKVDHEELRDALRTGKQDLIEELKATLKMKAKGFRYTEEKIIEKFDEAGNSTGKTVETYKKYAPPDLGAIHLLLKNLDDTWRNDDKATLDLKKEQVEIARMKAEENNW